MKERILRQINEFYRELRAPAGTEAKLLQSAESTTVVAGGEDGARSRAVLRWRRGAAWVGIAAGLVAAFGLGYARGLGHQAVPSADGPIRGVSDMRTPPAGARSARISEEEIARSSESTDPRELAGKPSLATIPRVLARPGLVMVQVSADWCPRTPKVRPLFDELARRYAAEDVLLVTFNVTGPADRRQAAFLAQSLGILEVLGHKWEPGMIQLVDAEAGTIVESLRAVEEQTRFEQRLAAPLVPKSKP